MSSLQVGLAIAGGLVLAGLVAHSTWMSRRAEPRRAVDESGEAKTTFEPIAMPGGGLGSGAVLSSANHLHDKRLRIDPLIDVVVPLALDHLVSGDAVLANLPHTRRVGTKPFLVEGRNDASGQWEQAEPGRRYNALQVAVQLANRKGALNEIEFSEFVMKAQAFADALGGSPEFPEMLHEVARARELDQFASEHDAQLSVCLRARGAAWSPGYIMQQAARQGFVAGAVPGRMVLPGSQPGMPVLSLSFDTQAALAEDPNEAAIFELALSLDAPHVPREEEPFARMGQVALALAQEMEGVVTDDRGNRLVNEAIEAIAIDLAQLYDELDAHDLSAGSPQARRLFS
ncbi:cell division protein FtsZ [Comamonas serinivorans]|uniref:Cell division protein ZipA n=1 Tax=Comamonas serinivorans TaxID=1082851 RepID=A0A1Y0EMQ3_9BURK|nr:cell division protein ZipA C-terminal FtsZ-binding domain-containing protein [Comamonas serinivorans]ARU04688.1 cell division protein FtsZ [Comamonas serinivorans]